MSVQWRRQLIILLLMAGSCTGGQMWERGNLVGGYGLYLACLLIGFIWIGVVYRQGRHDHEADAFFARFDACRAPEQ